MRKLRVGMIGVGSIGLVHLHALRTFQDVEVVSITSKSQMKERAERLRVASYYTDYKEMIDQENLDVVHICTTNNTHFEMAHYAISKGLHVVLEKPMTQTIKEAIKLDELVKKHNIVHEVHFHNRFYPVNDYMKRHRDVLGDIQLIYGHYVQDWMTHQESFNWRALKKFSGDTRVISDIGSHFFDLVEYVSGHRIIEVFAELKTIYDKRAGHHIDTEDLGVVLFKTEKGALGNLVVSQSVPGKKNELKTTYVGTKATFEWDGVGVNRLTLGHVDKENEVIDIQTIETLKDGTKYGVPGFFEAFVECFRQVYEQIKKPQFKGDFAGIHEGLHSMKLIDAIYQSHQLKKWVKVDA